MEYLDQWPTQDDIAKQEDYQRREDEYYDHPNQDNV